MCVQLAPRKEYQASAWVTNSNDDPGFPNIKTKGKHWPWFFYFFIWTEFLTFHTNVLEPGMDSLKSFSQSFAHRESNLHVLFSSSFLTLHLISAPSNNFPLNTCLLLHYRGMTKAQAILCYHVSSTLAGPSQDLCHLPESSVSDELSS